MSDLESIFITSKWQTGNWLFVFDFQDFTFNFDIYMTLYTFSIKNYEMWW